MWEVWEDSNLKQSTEQQAKKLGNGKVGGFLQTD